MLFGNDLNSMEIARFSAGRRRNHPLQKGVKLRHIKRGTVYTVICFDTMDGASGLEDYTTVELGEIAKLMIGDTPWNGEAPRCQIEKPADYHTIFVLYIGEAGDAWLRPLNDFEGRFEILSN